MAQTVKLSDELVEDAKRIATEVQKFSTADEAKAYVLAELSALS